MNVPHYADESVTLWHGDCLDVLRTLADASVDAVVTDPPYGLEFMGKSWDSFGRGEATSDAAAGMAATGYTDGATRLERPSFMGGTNPKCRACGLWQRGGNPCVCASPDFPNERRARSAAFGEWCEQWSAECLRVLKPGGHLLAFGGTRTWHRLACAVEDAGFEVRDSIAWLYGSGFPKSLDVSKAIDKVRSEDRAPVDAVRSWLNARRIDAGWSHDAINKHFGHASNGGGSSSSWMTNPTSKALPTWEQWGELKRILCFSDEMDAEVWRLNGRKGKPGDNWESREVVGMHAQSDPRLQSWAEMQGNERGVAKEKRGAPATDDARTWQGWGTALKPAFEPIVVARKPLVGTVAANVLAHGTGALNIDGCRIGAEERTYRARGMKNLVDQHADSDRPYVAGLPNRDEPEVTATGRWPANVVLDESQAVELDRQSGEASYNPAGTHGTQKGSANDGAAVPYSARKDGDGIFGYGDRVGASRFFLTAGSGNPAVPLDAEHASFRYTPKAPTAERPREGGIAHPTVKPLDLMRWLVRLVTPPGGTVLEPFAGSGTTAEACVIEGFRCIAIEREADYLPLIVARLSKPIQPSMFGGVA